MQILYRALFILSPMMVLALVVGFYLQMLWLPPVIFFGVLPLLDHLIGSRPIKWSAAAQKELAKSLWLRGVPVLNALAWCAGWVWSIAVAPQVWAQGAVAFATWVLAVGIVGGALGITTAHELVHRSSPSLRTLGGVVLSTVCYGVFKVEHVRGHHLRVATADDAVSARRGETLYAFLPRAVAGVVGHAFALEAQRLRKLGRSPWSIANECVQWALLSASMGALTWWVSGAPGALLFLGSAVVAIMLLEMVDYVEHYGITRDPGERVGVRHSWDHDSLLTNFFLINLQRHADHHAHGGKPFGALVNHDEAPKLPASYGAMLLLAHVPPLFMRVMHPRLDNR
jgi:alkane 1-monooxygenase